MKKSKKIIICCLLFMTFTISSIYMYNKISYTNNTEVKDTLALVTATPNNFIEDNSATSLELDTNTKNYNVTTVSKKIGKTLSATDVDKELAKLTKAPTYSELLQLAKDNYGMSEDTFKVAFGWVIGEGYDSARNSAGVVDHYLGYLCDCIGINFYMGYGITTPSGLAAKIGGYDHSGYYSVSSMQNRAQKAINNPSSYAAQYKGMYLALRYPDENAHDCDGVSNYTRYGGTVYYSGRGYNGSSPIKVWSLWYSGIKHWKKTTSPLDRELENLDYPDSEIGNTKRLNYAELCKLESFRNGSKIAGIIIEVLKWATPLILTIIGMIDFIKAIKDDDKNNLNKATFTFMKRCAIAIIIPFIPGLVYYLIDLFTGVEKETEEFVSCTECLRESFKCNTKIND